MTGQSGDRKSRACLLPSNEGPAAQLRAVPRVYECACACLPESLCAAVSLVPRYFPRRHHGSGWTLEQLRGPAHSVRILGADLGVCVCVHASASCSGSVCALDSRRASPMAAAKRLSCLSAQALSGCQGSCLSAQLPRSAPLDSRRGGPTTPAPRGNTHGSRGVLELRVTDLVHISNMPRSNTGGSQAPAPAGAGRAGPRHPRHTPPHMPRRHPRHTAFASAAAAAPAARNILDLRLCRRRRAPPEANTWFKYELWQRPLTLRLCRRLRAAHGRASAAAHLDNPSDARLQRNGGGTCIGRTDKRCSRMRHGLTAMAVATA